MSESRTPSLGGLIKEAMEARLRGLHVGLPGVILTFDPSSCTATVRLSIKKKLFGPNDAKVLEEYPVLRDVPVKFPRCAKGYFSLPLATNDRVEVRFSERNLGAWKASKNKEPVDAGDTSVHSLSGAYCVPGLYPDLENQSLTPPYSTDNMVLAVEGTAKLHLGANNDPGMQYVALAQKVLDELDKIKTAFNGHTHSVVFGACTAGGTTGTAPTAGPGTSYTSASVAAAKVKAL